MKEKNLELVSDSICIDHLEAGVEIKDIEAPLRGVLVIHHLPDSGCMSRGYDETYSLGEFRGSGRAVNKESGSDDVAISVDLGEFVKVCGYVRVPVK